MSWLKELPPEKVEVPLPCELIIPPERVRPPAEARPSLPTESPPENVEVAFPWTMREAPMVVVPVRWEVVDALNEGMTLTMPPERSESRVRLLEVALMFLVRMVFTSNVWKVEVAEADPDESVPQMMAPVLSVSRESQERRFDLKSLA
jgi:hypothetical protein